MTQKIIFLKGLPASGKSTWAYEFVMDNPSYYRVNKDDIRLILHKWVYSKANEVLVNEYQMSLASTALAKGMSVIVDNTHLFGSHEADYRQLANDMDVEFEVKFFDTPIETCIERDGKREWRAKVGSKVITQMAQKAQLLSSWKKLEFEEVIQSFWENSYVFDIDGTLAKMEWRSPYDMSKVGEDSLNIPVAWILRELAINNRIIICSGREDSCRKETEEWLAKHEVTYDELFMRKEGDNRNDAIIKYEILVNDIIPKYYVRGVFDDRDRVVSMWRQAWLMCCQVDYGNF